MERAVVVALVAAADQVNERDDALGWLRRGKKSFVVLTSIPRVRHPA